MDELGLQQMRLSPACLIFFIKLKTENQLIRFEVASA